MMLDLKQEVNVNEPGNAKERLVIARARNRQWNTLIATVSNGFAPQAFWCFCAVVGGLLIAPLAAANRWSELAAIHPNHFSTAEVGWNEKTGKFEVALCVWPSDLEKALSEKTGKSIDLEKSEGLNQLIAEYVASKFTILKVQAKSSEPDLQTGSESQKFPLNKASASETVAAPAVSNPDEHPSSATPEPMQADSSSGEASDSATVDASNVESKIDESESMPNEPIPSKSTDAESTTTTELKRGAEAIGGRRNSDFPAENDSHDHIPLRVDESDDRTVMKMPDGFRWVGFESNAKDAWLYFELPGDMEPATFTIENRVFFEFNVEQINQIRFTCAGQTRSFSLKRNEPSRQIVTERSKRRQQN
jgi:hypothetical protein